MGPLTPLYWTFGDICPGFQSQDGPLANMFPYLYTRDFSDSPLMQHLLGSQYGSWAILIHILDPHVWSTYSVLALVVLESEVERAAASQQVTRQMLYKMSFAGSALIKKFSIWWHSPCAVSDLDEKHDRDYVPYSWGFNTTTHSAL